MSIAYYLGRVDSVAPPTSIDRLGVLDAPRMPAHDFDAYRWNERHRWVYNKLFLAEVQEIESAPHGIAPTHYPVSSQPIYDLRGLGAGRRTLHTVAEYRRYCSAGYFWRRCLSGEQLRTDLAVTQGSVRWSRHAVASTSGEGSYDHWVLEVRARDELSSRQADWVGRHLPDYTGMLNLDSIDGIIVAAGLRFTADWSALHPSGWLEAVAGLYGSGRWHYAETDRHVGYSFGLVGPQNRSYRYPPAVLLHRLRQSAQIASVQITFDADRALGAQASPQGDVRLAIVNSRELGAGLRAREELRRSFSSSASLEFIPNFER